MEDYLKIMFIEVGFSQDLQCQNLEQNSGFQVHGKLI